MIFFRLIVVLFLGSLRSFYKKFSNKNFSQNNESIILTVRKNSGLSNSAQALALKNKISLKKIFYIQDHSKIYEVFNKIIFVGNPDIVLPSIRLLKLKIFSSYNIGLWFWELGNCPKSWKILHYFVDEVWVQSSFIKNTLVALNKPIKVIPFNISVPLKKSLLKKSELNFLAEDFFEKKFIFMFTFDFLSFYERKNPKDLILAFSQAFKDNNNVSLVIKCSNSSLKNKEFEDMMSYIKKMNHSKIYLITKSLSSKKYYSLLNNIDCYISMHRSEGLGLTMAEAMYYGKPVIATGYSGNLEFMNSKNSYLLKYNLVPVAKDDYIYGKDQMWAQPSIQDASFAMKKVYEDKAYRKKISKEAQLSMRSSNVIV